MTYMEVGNAKGLSGTILAHLLHGIRPSMAKKKGKAVRPYPSFYLIH